MNKKLSHTLAVLFCAAAFFPAYASAQFFNYTEESQEEYLAEDQRVITLIDSSHKYNLDPFTANYTSEAQILISVNEGLFSYHPETSQPLNALCSSYKVSRDKKKWTFTLISGATFSNGDPITAETIRSSWIRLLSTPDAPFSSFLDSVRGAKDFRLGKTDEKSLGIYTRDDATLIVLLDKPMEHLPKLLCNHAFAAISEKEGVYSGPFVIDSYKDGILELKKNEKFHDASSILIPGIRIIQSDDIKENTFAFNNGSADWIDSLADSLKILNKDAIHIQSNFGTSFLFFKNKNHPWNNASFRRALLTAIPYDKLREKFYVKAKTLVYPLSGYPEIYGVDDYDPFEAKELMSEARKENGISEDEKIPLVFALYDEESEIPLFNLLKEAWDELGVDLQFQTRPSYLYNSSIPYWDADLFSYSWIGDFADPLAFLELFRSDSSLNVSLWKNNEFDSLLDQALIAENNASHMEKLSKAEQILLDDGEIIPLFHSISMHIINTSVIGGWSENPLNIHPFRYLYIRNHTYLIPNIAKL